MYYDPTLLLAGFFMTAITAYAIGIIVGGYIK
jgi:hypothetical protein